MKKRPEVIDIQVTTNQMNCNEWERGSGETRSGGTEAMPGGPAILVSPLGGWCRLLGFGPGASAARLMQEGT